MTQPVARTECLDNLAGLPPTSNAGPNLWTEVHEQVQEQFALLENDVCRKVAGVRVNAGRTKGDRFFLFTYRTFSMPSSALDPVVVGMTFAPAQQGVAVEADVSGEQTGDIILSVPGKTVADSRQELLRAAREIADALRQSVDAITVALNDASRRVE